MITCDFGTCRVEFHAFIVLYFILVFLTALNSTGFYTRVYYNITMLLPKEIKYLKYNNTNYYTLQLLYAL